MILSFFYVQVTRCYLPGFRPIGFSVLEKKRKIHFQHGGHLGFPIETILAIFVLQVTPMLLTEFKVNWFFGSSEEAKNRFSRWPRNNFSYFDLHVTPLLPTKFQVNLPFSSGEEVKNRFSSWPPRRLSWILLRNDSSYLIYKSPRCYQVSNQLSFWLRRRSEK